jgi:uncharacterized protein (TIGR00730 family)
MFIKYAKAFIVCAGGFGTMDEFFEAVTLVQTGCIKPIPVILVGRSYWNGLYTWFVDTLIKDGIISKKELALIQIVDTPEEVLKIVENT